LYVVGTSTGRTGLSLVIAAAFSLWCYQIWPGSFAPRVKTALTATGALLIALSLYLAVRHFDSWMTQSGYRSTISNVLSHSPEDGTSQDSGDKAQTKTAELSTSFLIDQLFTISFIFEDLRKQSVYICRTRPLRFTKSPPRWRSILLPIPSRLAFGFHQISSL